MKETVVRNGDEAEDFVCKLWSDVTLDEVQLVFREWRRRPEWVCKHD
jgi:hypothetical protein